MLDVELLDILVCPQTKQPLRLADEATLARLNRAALDGALKNRAGEVVRAPLDAGLLREDGRVLYPVRDGIPVMLLDEAIEVDPAPDPGVAG
ncbi:MAG: hypothetical protein RQ751_04670 [Longimicrobiales bacterium]|nr:hypothetical protein [Longimicrobiales bacterium]